MVNTTERAVIDPNYWLAQPNALNRHASEIPFIPRAVKEVSRSLSVFRKDHPLSPPTLPRKIRDVISIGSKSIFIAFVLLAISNLPSTINDLKRLDRLVYLNYLKKVFQSDDISGSISWSPVTLPWKITPEWTIEQSWIQNNCDSKGNLKGTDFPPSKVYSDADPKLFAEAVCRTFSNPPEYLIP